MTLTSLQVSSPGHSPVGREKEGELATLSLQFEFRLHFSCDSLLTELADLSPISVKHKQAQNNVKKH